VTNSEKLINPNNLKSKTFWCLYGNDVVFHAANDGYYLMPIGKPIFNDGKTQLRLLDDRAIFGLQGSKLGYQGVPLGLLKPNEYGRELPGARLWYRTQAGFVDLSKEQYYNSTELPAVKVEPLPKESRIEFEGNGLKVVKNHLFFSVGSRTVCLTYTDKDGHVISGGQSVTQVVISDGKIVQRELKSGQYGRDIKGNLWFFDGGAYRRLGSNDDVTTIHAPEFIYIYKPGDQVAFKIEGEANEGQAANTNC